MALVWGLAGCGFQPLYGEHTRSIASAESAQISVAPIPERVGQIIRNELLDRLNPRGEPQRPKYRLDATVQEQREGLAFQRDQTVTRFNLTVSATYSLSESGSGKVLVRGQARTIASYNVVQSEFANVVAERDAETRAAKEVGEEISLRIGVFLSAKPTGG